MEKWKNPPSVNTEKLKLSLFSCYDRRLSRCPPPFFFVFVLFPSFFLSFFVFSSWREKGGRRGTQRRFEHRHSVYIYQNFFAFDRAIAIKMCSCNHCGLGCLLLFFLSPQLFLQSESSEVTGRQNLQCPRTRRCFHKLKKVPPII